MEDKKNNNTQAGGQHITVRPGNFTPPAKPDRAHQEGQGGQQNGQHHRPKHPQGGQHPQSGGQGKPQGSAQGEGNGHNHSHKKRHNRHKHGNRRPESQGAQNAPQQNGNQNQNIRPQNGNQNQNIRPQNGNQNNRLQNGVQGKPQGSAQDGKDRHSKPSGGDLRGGRPDRAKPDRIKKANPEISSTLQRELDEEFSTTLLSPRSSLPAKKRAVETAVDSKEFEVDISTAAYLIEDVPCGLPTPDVKSVEVVGVRFRSAGKMYFFSPNGIKFALGDKAIVDTARGPELGDIVMLNRRIAEREIIQPLRAVLRCADENDLARYEENRRKESEALKICEEKIKTHKLDMRLVDAQYTFDNSKLLFYFTSEGRVDFRDLVRDLASVFHTRIELRQIGIRDESRLIGGLGLCGRPFCCATFLSDFGQVSVKMAKEQGLSINASKISGCCGRLMCCLRYEHETYLAEARLTPKKDTVVETADGVGVVVEATPLSGLLKVRLENAPEEDAVRVYHRDDVKVRSKQPQGAPAEDSREKEEATATTEAVAVEKKPTEALTAAQGTSSEE